jgi:hypothetical protein
LIIIFNALGLAFIGIGFGVAMLIRSVAGVESEGGTMLVLGPIVAATDLIFRFSHRDGHWFWPKRGGQLFFLPVWMFGVLWTVLGAVYLYRG